MVDSMRIRVTGAAETGRDLSTTARDVDDLPMDPVADKGVRILAELTPKRTGRLAQSSRTERGRDNEAVIAQGGGPVLYAGPINFGWRRRNIRPAHQLERATERLEPAAEQLLDDAVSDVIQRRGLT